MKRKFVSQFFYAVLFTCLCAANAYGANNKTIPANSAHFSFGPHIYFTNEVPKYGIATEAKELFIKPDGGYAYLVVDNYPDKFAYDQVQVKVYRSVNGSSQSYDEKTYTISTDLYYTYIKYSFFSTGYYIFDVYSKYGTFLGSANVTISNDNSSSSSGSTSCASGYKEYYNSSLGFSMCIPQDSYASDVSDGEDKINVNDFYGKKLSIAFMQEPSMGLDKFDATVVDLTRDMLKNSYSSFYRKEFKLLSSKDDYSIYRSVVSGTTSAGVNQESSVFYVRMYGKKIKDHDYMVINGPFADPGDDISYQIIIELGMLNKFKVY